jgi:hypothetical protein
VGSRFGAFSQSLFEAAFDGLLQQHLPQTDLYRCDAPRYNSKLWPFPGITGFARRLGTDKALGFLRRWAGNLGLPAQIDFTRRSDIIV